MFDEFCDCEDCQQRIALGNSTFQINDDEDSKLDDGAASVNPLDETRKTTKRRPLRFEYNTPRECVSIWVWLYFDWNYAYGWDGSSIQLREVGFRLFGVAISWTREWRG